MIAEILAFVLATNPYPPPKSPPRGTGRREMEYNYTKAELQRKTRQELLTLCKIRQYHAPSNASKTRLISLLLGEQVIQEVEESKQLEVFTQEEVTNSDRGCVPKLDFPGTLT